MNHGSLKTHQHWKRIKCDLVWNNSSLHSRLIFFCNKECWLLRKFPITKVHCHSLMHLILSFATPPPGPQRSCRPTLWPLPISSHQDVLQGSLGNVDQLDFCFLFTEDNLVQMSSSKGVNNKGCQAWIRIRGGGILGYGEHLLQLCTPYSTQQHSGHTAPQGKPSWATEKCFLSWPGFSMDLILIFFKKQ